jgi:hypothetical protein
VLFVIHLSSRRLMKQLAPGWRRIAFKLKIAKFCLA